MSKRTFLSRRQFLGIAAALPATTLFACGPLEQGGDEEGESAAAITSTCGPILDLKRDCGAKGDGIANDTHAFQKAARILSDENNKCGVLLIPTGVYIVGRQISRTQWLKNPALKFDPNGPFYQEEDIFTVEGLSLLRIVGGTNAIIRIAPGLHYGGFDQHTGAWVNSTPHPDDTQRADVGRIFDITACDEVRISNLELDGNSSRLVLGGDYGDKDRQCRATGIRLEECGRAYVTDVHTHHHGLDGITVGHGTTIPLHKKPHTLLRVVSEYNGRQGLSCGGWGLTATDCKFNHTGRVINHGGVESKGNGEALRSAPSAGVDIEPNKGSFARDMIFERCEFIDNAGSGLDANNGDVEDVTFDDCTFWGTDNWSIWVLRRGLVFLNSRIYGAAVHLHDGHTDADIDTPVPSMATVFDGCTFEDKPWFDETKPGSAGQVKRDSGYLYAVSGSAGAGVRFTDCTFIAHKVRGVLMGDATTKEIFDRCTFIHGNSDLAGGSAQSSFQGSWLRSCVFKETLAVTKGDKKYSIGIGDVIVAKPLPGDPDTRVEGQRVGWGSPSGKNGVITPGRYA